MRKESGSVPTGRHAPEGAEIEITPEMIEAGIGVAKAYGTTRDPLLKCEVPDFVREIYLAMRQQQLGIA